MYPGARADIDNVVGGANSVFIVLNDDHGVAEISQVDQGAKQAFVIALVQADRGLIQYVHHADQARADLAGEADTLRFAAGEGFRRTGERQVVQTDVDEELQAIANLFQNFFSNLRTLAGELQVVEEVHRVADAHVRDGRQRGIFHEHVPRFALQAGPFTAGAGTVADEFR